MAQMDRATVKRKILHTWPEDFDEVMGMLDMIVDPFNASRPPSPRVQLGVLKLCEGDIDEIAGLVDLANIDYRDVLALAEYPEQHRGWSHSRTDLSAAERQAYDDAVARDREQYLAWLNKPGV